MNAQTLVKAMLEEYRPQITKGDWKVLGSGNVSCSGQHAYGPDDREFPACDPMSKEWVYTNWVAFPGRAGDGSDIDPKLRAAIETFYRGRKCALLYKESSSSSYHFRSGDYFFLIDLSYEEDRALSDTTYDHGGEGFGLWPFKINAGSRGVSNPSYEKPDLFEEFVYSNFAQLQKLALDRGELDNFEMPKLTITADPDETSDDYWNRQMNMANSPNWTKKRDGD